MESSSKALTIAAAILLVILVIGAGMYVYTSSHNSIENEKDQMTEQEKTSFNQQWNTYEGPQGGNLVKALLQKVIANCNVNAEEEQRLVDVVCSRAMVSGTQKDINVSHDTLSDSVAQLTDLRNTIEGRHTYYVTLEYDSRNSLVSRIVIRYEQDDTIEDREV